MTVERPDGGAAQSLGPEEGPFLLHNHSESFSLHFDHEGIIQRVPTSGKPCVRWEDHDFKPGAGRITRLDYSIIKPQNETNTYIPVEVGFIGRMHPDEDFSPDAAHELLATKQFPRLEAWNVHINAALQALRGAVYPLSEGVLFDDIPDLERIHVRGVPGRMIDLNRQFPIPGDATTWEDVEKSVVYPEARLLVQMLKLHSDIRTLVSCHEDIKSASEPVAPRGPYYYETVPTEGKDLFAHISNKLYGNVTAKLLSRGFTPYHGVDDINDRDLGYSVHHGRVMQPIIHLNGSRDIDYTFETAFVELHRLGIMNHRDARSFVIEIPHEYTEADKRHVMDIYMTELILPFLRATGVRIPQ